MSVPVRDDTGRPATTQFAPPSVAGREPSMRDEASNDDAVSFIVARGLSGLESIRQEWQTFVDSRRDDVPLAHAPQWYDAYLETTRDPDRVYFFVARRRSELVGIFPFERRMLFVLGVPLPAWVLLSHDHMPFSDVIAPPDELSTLTPALLLALERQGRWALLVARNVLADSAAARLVAHSSFVQRLTRQRRDCHYLDCGQPYEGLLASFSRKHRANLRRHRGHMSELGTLETVWASDVPEIERCFGEFLAVEGSGWKGRAGQGTAIALHPELERYYRRLLYAFGSRGECELNLLRVDGKCIAAQFCVTIGGVWYLLKIGYDEQYAKHSPGSLLQEDVLIRLCAGPRVRLANLASDASWHLNWSPGALGLADHYLGAPGIVGAAAISLMRIRTRLARWVQTLRHRIGSQWSALRGATSRRTTADA